MADAAIGEFAKATGDLKEALTDAKAKMLLELEATVQVGYHMRVAQKRYWSAKIGKHELLIEAKTLEAAFDMRVAGLKELGVSF